MEQEKPHVILLAYHFPPSEAVGGARPFRFYKYLKRMGYSCEVVTASEQPEGGTPDVTYVPDEWFPVWEGKIRRPLTWSGHVERVIRKLAIPGCVGIVWARDVARVALEMVRRQGGRKVVLFTTYPPVGPALAGLLMSMKKRIAWISDFRDPLTFGSALPISSWRTRFVAKQLESALFRHATMVIANVQSAADLWQHVYPWCRTKMHVIWNGYDPENRPHAEPLPDSPEVQIVHAGDLYEGRNPNILIESLARLRGRSVAEALRTRILLVGPIGNLNRIAWDLYDTASREGWLELRKPVPKKDAAALISQSQGLLLVQPQTSLQVPAKLFEYISIGRPILALVPRSSSVEHVLENSGVPYRAIYTDDSPGDADGKLLEFLRLPFDPVRFSRWFEEHFDARQQTGQLASIIEKAADGG